LILFLICFTAENEIIRQTLLPSSTVFEILKIGMTPSAKITWGIYQS